MSFEDIAIDDTMPKSGTGKALSEALPMELALLKAMNPPPYQGLMADCHVAIQGDTLDKNFSKHAAETLSNNRRAEAEMFIKMGIPVSRIDDMLFERMGNVPLSTNLYEAAVFEAEKGPKGALPQNVRKWYTNALRDVTDDKLDTAIRNLEYSTHVGCVPLAILKERKGLGRAVVGKLGFVHPTKGNVTDWEFGGNGVRWV